MGLPCPPYYIQVPILPLVKQNPKCSTDGVCYTNYSQLDVTGLNYVSRREEPLVLMTVEHAAFSSDGQWLATVSGGFFLSHSNLLLQWRR